MASQPSSQSVVEKPPTSLESSSQSNDDDVFLDVNLSSCRFWLLSVALGLGMFLSILDSSIVATSLYTIGQEFGALQKINWVALAYTLAYLSCAVMFSRISDIVGRRNAYVTAFILFFGFSLGGGFAQSINQLIALRALQGIGGSGLYSLTMVMWPELASNAMKQYIAGTVGLVIAVAGVLGPVLGGLLTNYVSWRWVFWLNGPIGFISMVVFLMAWPDKKYLPDIERHPWTSLDFFGSLLVVAASVLVTFSFQNAGSAPNQWSHPVFIVPLTIGGLCWIALFVWEWWVDCRSQRPVLAAFPTSLTSNRVYVSGMLNTLCLGFPYLMMIYSFPVRLQTVNNKTPIMAGVLLLPMLGGVSVGSVFGGVLSSKKNRICEILVASATCVTVGVVLSTTLTANVELDAKSLGFLVFIGFGFGMSATACSMLATIESSIADHAPAQGIIAQLRILGGSLGIAASSAILAVKQQTQLTGIVDPKSLADPDHTPLTPAQHAAVRQTYSDAFREDMIVAACVSGLALVFAFGAYKKNRLTLEERRTEQILEETKRRRAARGGPEPTV